MENNTDVVVYIARSNGLVKSRMHFYDEDEQARMLSRELTSKYKVSVLVPRRSYRPTKTPLDEKIAEDLALEMLGRCDVVIEMPSAKTSHEVQIVLETAHMLGIPTFKSSDLAAFDEWLVHRRAEGKVRYYHSGWFVRGGGESKDESESPHDEAERRVRYYLNTSVPGRLVLSLVAGLFDISRDLARQLQDREMRLRALDTINYVQSQWNTFTKVVSDT